MVSLRRMGRAAVGGVVGSPPKGVTLGFPSGERQEMRAEGETHTNTLRDGSCLACSNSMGTIMSLTVHLHVKMAGNVPEMIVANGQWETLENRHT